MKQIHALVVDDEARFAENLARLLNARRIGAEAVNNGVHAVQAVERKSYDVVVLDVRMPGMNGIETLREIKQRNSEIEVIMLTGQADVETGIKAVREGAFDYLFKPCDIDMLVERIHEAATAGAIKRHPVLWPRKLVKEIGDSTFLRLETEDALSKALSIFNAIQPTGTRDELHVIDREDRLQGVIAKRDLIREAEKFHTGQRIEWQALTTHPEMLPEKRIGDVMRPPPPTQIYARPDEKLTEIADRMIQHNTRCLPVMEGERFVGIVRFRDVLHHVSAIKASAGDNDGASEY